MAGVVVTVTEVGGQQVHRADHRPYIAAVGQALESRDVHVAEATVAIAGNGRREAMLMLHPDGESFAAEAPEVLALRWDEDCGWRLDTGYRTGGTSTFREGTAVLPSPDAVAAWVVVALTYPALAAPGDVTGFRRHGDADPGFEARLARYAAGS